MWSALWATGIKKSPEISGTSEEKCMSVMLLEAVNETVTSSRESLALRKKWLKQNAAFNHTAQAFPIFLTLYSWDKDQYFFAELAAQKSTTSSQGITGVNSQNFPKTVPGAVKVSKFKEPNILAEVQKYLSCMLRKNNNNIVLFLSDGLYQDLKRF